MKKIVSIIAVLALASVAQATITHSISSAPTVGLAGHTTYTVTMTTDVGVITGMDSSVDGPAINHVNPAGFPTGYMNYNAFFGAVDVSQDSQFLFMTGTADGQVASGRELEGPTLLSCAFAFMGGVGSSLAGPSLEMLQVCMPDDVASTASGLMLIDGQEVDFNPFVIPEPASLALLGMGGLGVLLRRKR